MPPWPKHLAISCWVVSKTGKMLNLFRTFYICCRLHGLRSMWLWAQNRIYLRGKHPPVMDLDSVQSIYIFFSLEMRCYISLVDNYMLIWSVQTLSLLRLAELLPFVDINRHWGIISKCLTYSKAASDPFAYSLLRQQYKKVLVTVVNKLLRRDLYPSSGHNSSLDTENDYCLQRIS